MKFIANIPTFWIDCLLYFAIAVLASAQGIAGSDEAAKYIDLAVLFYIKSFAAISLAGIGALKMFRSTAFADHLASQKPQETAPAAEPSK